MWIINFLPYWIFHVVLGIGLIGLASTYLLRFIPIPAIYMYKTPIQLGSIVIIAFGVYMSGAISNNKAWEERVNELQKKVAEAEAKSSQENVKIVEKIVTKTKLVQVKGEEIVKYIDREIAKYDDRFSKGSQCEIPKEFYEALNKATETPK